MKKILFIINSLGGGGAEKALIEFLRHIDYTTKYRCAWSSTRAAI